MNESIDRTPEYWREHFQLDHMAINAKLDTPSGYVIRVKPREYCLRHVQPGPRARWGTSHEISEDIAYMAKWGTLPPQNGGPW